MQFDTNKMFSLLLSDKRKAPKKIIIFVIIDYSNKKPNGICIYAVL